VAPDLARTLGFGAVLPRFAVVCGDAMGAADAAPFPVLELRADFADEPRGSARLLEDPRAVTFLRDHGVTALVFFKVSHRLVEAAERAGFRVLNGSPAVAQRFENKLHFAAIASERRLPALASETFPGGLPEYSAVARLGAPLVVQLARGHSGEGTFLVESEAAWSALRVALAGKPARASRFVEGPVFTLNGCVFAEAEPVVYGPYLQWTGLELCTPRPLGACGNAWDPRFGGYARLEGIGRDVGRALADAGYFGAYGVDVLVDAGGQAHLIEVNPRITSGFALETLLLASKAAAPPGLAHILATGGQARPLHAEPPEVGSAGQLVFYLDGEAPALVTEAPRSGTYALAEGALVWRGPSLDVRQAQHDEAVAFFGSPGRLVARGGEYARIQVRRSLVEPDRIALDVWGEAVANAVRGAVRLEAA
jgi:hypothetical protein